MAADGGSGFSAAEFVAAIRRHENFVLRRLDEIEFTGAQLKGANFKGANLNGAYMSCADISGANLSSASLNRADLRGARIQGASFEYAEMDGADFRQSMVVSTDKNDKWKVLGKDANHATTVSFANCSLKGAKLNNANLKDANFDGALLNGASFGGATLGNASFEGAVLIGVNLKDLRVPQDRLKNCVTDPGAELRASLPQFIAILDSAQVWAESGGKNGAAGNLDGKDIRLLAKIMKERKLTGIRCARTMAVDADFSGCELQAANFDGADLRGALFIGADLRGASFKGANLGHANFARANLLPLALNSGMSLATNFEGAAMDRVNFQEAQRAAA
jgi:uncharacterized protein YjbI with pentapeptide repeats